MSRSAPTPPPPPEDWSPPVPTEGPLAGSAAAPPVVPVMAPRPVAAPSRTGRKLVGIVVALAVIAGIAFAVKTVVLDSSEAPGEAEVDAAFTKVSGFTYAELPSDLVEQAQQFIDANPEASDAIGSFDIRQVKEGGTPVGAVMIFGVDPGAMGDSFKEEFTTGFQGGTAGDVGITETTIDGVDVLSVSMPLGAGNMFFDTDDGFIFFVQGNDQRVTDELTSGLIKGNF